MAIVLGYHGCDQETAQHLLGGCSFVSSDKPYDWLGTGSYFWEGDIVRAYEWAKERRPLHPCVVGAVLELGNCLDLTTRTGIAAVKSAYTSYKVLQESAGQPLPRNRAMKKARPDELTLRFLDKAVMDHLHRNYKLASERTQGVIQEFDTVRALFPEGELLYEEAGFQEKTHIQIAVRFSRQVKGVFRVPPMERYELGIPDLYDFKSAPSLR